MRCFGRSNAPKVPVRPKDVSQNDRDDAAVSGVPKVFVDAANAARERDSAQRGAEETRRELERVKIQCETQERKRVVLQAQVDAHAEHALKLLKATNRENVLKNEVHKCNQKIEYLRQTVGKCGYGGADNHLVPGLVSMLGAAENEYRGLKEELALAKGELDALKSDVKNCDELQVNNNALKEQVKQRDADNNALKEQVKQRDANNNALKEQVKQRDADTIEQTETIRGLYRQLDDIEKQKESITQLRRDNHILRVHLDSKTSSCDGMLDKNDALKAQVKEQDAEIANHRTTIKQLELDIRSLRKQLKDKLRSVDGLQDINVKQISRTQL